MLALILLTLQFAAAAESPGTLTVAFDAIDRGDLVSAASVLEPLATGGDPRAQAALSLVLGSGPPDVRSSKSAAEWIQQAAAGGLASASLELGNRYFTGDGLARDPGAAVKSWRIAADAGLAQAQYNLGIAYALGTGIERAAHTAGRWLELAADGGHTDASFALGVLYANGDLGEPDYRTACALIEQAATAGHAIAQFNLGFLFEHGLGGPQDLAQARRWYLAAAAQGVDAAVPALAKISPENPGDDHPVSAEPVPRIFGAAWLRGQDPDYYTLQIAASPDEKAIRDSLVRYAPNIDSAYFKFGGSGSKPYVAILGSFVNLDEANAALNELPAVFKSNNPWVRRFATLQRRLDDPPGAPNGGSSDPGR